MTHHRFRRTALFSYFQSRSRAVAARESHKLKAAGSNPASASRCVVPSSRDVETNPLPDAPAGAFFVRNNHG